MTKQELDIWKAVTNFTKGQEGANLKARELFDQLKKEKMEEGLLNKGLVISVNSLSMFLE